VKNNFFDHAPFGVGDLDLEKTIFSEFGMKIEKNNFLTTPTFYADDLDLEKTIFSEFGMKIEKNNFLTTPTFYADDLDLEKTIFSEFGMKIEKKIFLVDLDLDWNLFRVFPTLCTLFGIDALIYNSCHVSERIESVI
jgi:hypothetical protein